MSVARSGDWIDDLVAKETDNQSRISLVTAKKEKQLNLSQKNANDTVLDALIFAYGEMLRYVFKHFQHEFGTFAAEFDAPIEIVVSGGTTMPSGFCELATEIVKEMDFPFQILRIRPAKEPHNSVAKGCLVKALLVAGEPAESET